MAAQKERVITLADSKDCHVMNTEKWNKESQWALQTIHIQVTVIIYQKNTEFF
jgi:hypothetical protein